MTEDGVAKVSQEMDVTSSQVYETREEALEAMRQRPVYAATMDSVLAAAATVVQQYERGSTDVNGFVPWGGMEDGKGGNAGLARGVVNRIRAAAGARFARELPGVIVRLQEGYDASGNYDGTQYWLGFSGQRLPESGVAIPDGETGVRSVGYEEVMGEDLASFMAANGYPMVNVHGANHERPTVETWRSPRGLEFALTELPPGYAFSADSHSQRVVDANAYGYVPITPYSEITSSGI